MVANSPKRRTSTKQQNRRERRKAIQRLIEWTGRCWCEKCNGRPWPHIYTYDAKAGRRKRGRPDDRLRTVVSYECFIESLYRTAKVRGVGAEDTTDSASAAGLRWLEDMHVGGVDIQINEAHLPPEAWEDMELEVVRHASLVKYLDQTFPGDPHRRAEREKRYWDLCAEFDDPRRLHQWFYVEFPGWLKQQYHARRRSDV